ncbi:MAG: VanZ family protein [Clostridia bacterium]|nr:VanZ family protein [Clostridia bacterium]
MLSAAWSYIDNTVPFILIAAPFILCWRIVSAFMTSKSRGCTFFKSINVLREILIILFSVFVIGLVSQTVIPHMEWSDGGFTVSIPENYVAKYNFIPFAAISDALHKIFVDINLYYVIYLVGNIIVFVPVGFFIALLPQKEIKAWHAAGISFLVSVFIEMVQMFLPRMVDVDDIILNTLGGFSGYLLYLLLKKAAPAFVKRVKM